MNVWFVSRHPGALAWLARRELHPDRVTAHLDPAEIAAGDVVIGTLPMSAAADICSRGARFIALDLNLPSDMRGRELTEEELRNLNCTLTEYRVSALPITEDLKGNVT